MERTGAQIDQSIGQAQENVGAFSLRVGHALNQAGQSVGNAANNAGTRVHDWLVPGNPAEPTTTVTPGQQPPATIGP